MLRFNNLCMHLLYKTENYAKSVPYLYLIGNLDNFDNVYHKSYIHF